MATARPRRWSRRALLALGASSFVAACGGGDSTPPTPTPQPRSRLLVTPTPRLPRPTPGPATPIPPPAPARVTYVWEDIVTAADRKLVGDIVPVVQEFFFKVGEHYVRVPILVQNVVGLPTVANAERIGRNGTIQIDPVGSWSRLDDTAKREVVAHEWFHQVQFDYRLQDNREAYWIVEGAAEYAAYSFVVSNGWMSWVTIRNRAIAAVRQGGALPPTGSLAKENLNDNRYLYSLLLLAVDNLLTGADVTTLINFYKLLPQRPWAEAFATAFGKDIFAYEAEFDALRRRQGI